MVNPVLMTSLKKGGRDDDPRMVAEGSEVDSCPCQGGKEVLVSASTWTVATPSQRQEFHDRTETDDDVAPRDRLDLDEVQTDLFKSLLAIDAVRI